MLILDFLFGDFFCFVLFFGRGWVQEICKLIQNTCSYRQASVALIYMWVQTNNQNIAPADLYCKPLTFLHVELNTAFTFLNVR